VTAVEARVGGAPCPPATLREVAWLRSVLLRVVLLELCVVLVVLALVGQQQCATWGGVP